MKRGMTIVECVVYLALLGMITLLVHQLVVKTVTLSLCSSAHSLDLYLAYDTLMNDIARSQQVKRADSRLSLQVDQTTVIWKMIRTTLYRTTEWQTEDLQRHKATAVVAKGVTQVTFAVQREASGGLSVKGFIAAGQDNIPFFSMVGVGA